MRILLSHRDRQKLCPGVRTVKRLKGFTLIELLMMVLVAVITVATVIPKLLSMTDDAARSAGSSILSALETANSLTFSRQLVKGLTGPYTMGDIVSHMDVKGVESSEVTLSSYKVRVHGRWYEFELSAAPDVPSSQGSIKIAVAPSDVSDGLGSANTAVVPPPETDREAAEHRKGWEFWFWSLLQHIIQA
jgi:type II secretory pathway pseudopilin PulG